MRATEIEIGKSYAATGKEISLAKVKVLGTSRRPDGTQVYTCLVEEGVVYTGWSVRGAALDMDYSGAGHQVSLQSRDILRPWEDEELRRQTRAEYRDKIRNEMREMDQMLTEMGLPDSQVQLIQLPDNWYTVVAILDLNETRQLYARISRTTVGPPVGGTTTPPAGPELP